MSSFVVSGTLHVKGEIQQVSATFKKREFVLMFADNPSYPQYVSFQLVQDRVGLIDQFEVGSQLEVSFNLRGREWTAPDNTVKYFNSLEAWRISAAQVAQVAQPSGQAYGGSAGGSNATNSGGNQSGFNGGQTSNGAQSVSDEDDDLPF